MIKNSEKSDGAENIFVLYRDCQKRSRIFL